MQLSDLDYPVLRINERGVLRVKKSREIRCMPEIFFERGGFGGETFFVDRMCQKSVVLDIQKRRRSWDLDYLLGPHKMYVVDYEIGPSSQLAFEEARDAVMELIVRKRWYAQGDESREEFTKRFTSYQSMGEVIDSISGYGKVWY